MEKLWLASLLLAGIAYQFDGTTGAGNVIADGPKMRIEFTRGDGVVFKDSSVVITTDGGKTLTLLDPPRKTYMTVNLDELVGAPTIGKVKLSARDLGAGGTMEGYPTHKWAVDGTYDVSIGGTAMHFTMHSESWRTDRIADEAQFRRGSMVEKLLPPQVKGFPLKEETTIRAGNSAAVTSTTEIHGVRSVKPPPSTFTVPPGYKRK